MAVQAQYPSNILFLNRNAQEGHDYSLQAQEGLYLDQSHMLFSNGVGGNSTNQRKRGRETSVATEITTPMIPFSLQQSQPPQLHNHNHNHHQNHPNVVSTGLRLSFGDQQQQQQQQLQQHHHNQQQRDCHSASSLFSVWSEDFASQIKQQRDELDQFLQTQGEQLQRTLAEKRQRHYRALLGAAEDSISRKLREKEAEVQKATRRNAELEARAAQLCVEAQIWQAKARAQETTAASLQVQIQQAKAMMSAGFQVAGEQDSRRVDDGLTCAENQAEDAESAYMDPERATASGPSCKACRKRVASVVLLPCRHLCLCTECDQMVQSCPLCLTLRNSSVEVFLC
ncbi:E3 ubiquitin-protein ligase BOI-like [Argentina anserina]|uniref:E3 ubiquitin-protein ligase BOI-like n=1 Tax=Argentina anserina TaxID=57926 RepID=UPI00217623FA|nr:E3 ubiquitin-protein ligase BOI-like [Potentilla anserina]